MIKVIEITPLFSFAAGFIGDRFSYMKNYGYDMHLICTPTSEIESFVKRQDISYFPVQINRVPTLVADIKALYSIIQYVRNNNIDLIVGHADKGTLLAGLVGLITHKKVITYIHGTNYETCDGIKRKIFIFIDWFQTKLSTINICVSSFLVDLRTDLNIAPRNKQFVPNEGSCCGIECIDKFNPDKISESDKCQLRQSLGINKDDFVIGFCGRLTKDKGIEELVESFKMIQQKLGNRVKLLLVGDKDIRDAVSKLIHTEILTNKSIVCTGVITDRIEMYYSIMNLFVLPTHRDGFGMCLIEAQAMGVPVLSSPYTGSKNAMLAGWTGEYIEIDPTDIKNKTIDLFNHTDKLSFYSKNAKEWIPTHFSNIDVWNSIIDIYNSVLTQK